MAPVDLAFQLGGHVVRLVESSRACPDQAQVFNVNGEPNAKFCFVVTGLRRFVCLATAEISGNATR